MRTVAALFSALLACAVAADTGYRERIGTAFQRGADQVLYYEVHRERIEAGRVVEDRVTYLDGSREAFAEKVVDFRRFALAPDFTLEDRRTGYLESLHGLPPRRVVQVRAARGEAVRSATLAADHDLVADSGFDRFIETHWEALLSGEVLIRQFLIPSRLEALAFRIRHTGTVGGSEAFTLDIDSALLRLLVPTIHVRYDATTRRLLRYEGLSNIRGTDGDNLDVLIEFSPTRPVHAAR